VRPAPIRAHTTPIHPAAQDATAAEKHTPEISRVSFAPSSVPGHHQQPAAGGSPKSPSKGGQAQAPMMQLLCRINHTAGMAAGAIPQLECCRCRRSSPCPHGPHGTSLTTTHHPPITAGLGLSAAQKQLLSDVNRNLTGTEMREDGNVSMGVLTG
jgi:hypothetical protein